MDPYNHNPHAQTRDLYRGEFTPDAHEEAAQILACYETELELVP